MADNHDITDDDIEDKRTAVWIQDRTLYVSLFTYDNQNHVFEINLDSYTYSSSIDELY
jgi:hypothetical protein